MRYVITVDIEHGQDRVNYSVERVDPPKPAVNGVMQVKSGSGFDLTQALIYAGVAVSSDARKHPSLWGHVK